MTSSPLQISVLPQTKKTKKSSQSKSILSQVSTDSKESKTKKTPSSDFAQILLNSTHLPAKQTRTNLAQSQHNLATNQTSKISKNQAPLLSQKQFLTQHKIKLQNKQTLSQKESNLQEALLVKKPKTQKTLRDIQQITQDHKLNLTKLEISSSQERNPKPKTLAKKPTREITQNIVLQNPTPQSKTPREALQSPSKTKRFKTLAAHQDIPSKIESKPTKKQTIAPMENKSTPKVAKHAPTPHLSTSQEQPTQTQQAPIQQALAQQIPQNTPSAFAKESILAGLLAQNNEELKSEEKIEEKKSEKAQDLPLGELKRDTQFKIAQSRETITHFSQRLKEEIANYKPPFTKLSMELNPQELGKLEVTITKKGKELQIQINANNPNALQAFIQNQNEFRSTLANVGFNNVELNFSQGDSQGQQKRQEGENQKGNKNSLEDYKDAPLATSMEIKMVQYA